MSKSNKLVSVFGASGAQGGAVVQALLKSDYKVRAFTRNPESESSQKLKTSGVDVVKLDLEQPESDIVKGLEGSYGVFLLTNYWSYFEKEFDYGKKATDAALKAGVTHLVYSSLSPCNIISQGKISVPHFDFKFKVEEYIREVSKANPNFISTFIYVPGYMQNFHTYFGPKKSETDDSWILSLPQDPTVPLDLGDINDIGLLTVGILDNQSKYSGSVIPFSGSYLTGSEMAEVISKVTGKSVKYNYIPTNIYKTFPFPGAVEMAAMFDFYNQYGAFYGQDKTIAPTIFKARSFEEYLRSTNYKLE